MAGRFNRFGATTADVTILLKTGAYAPVDSEFGGTAAIEAFMDDAVDDIIQMMPEAMFQSILDVVLEKVEQRATQGQDTVNTGLFPLVDGKTHVWTGQPAYFQTKPRLRTDLLRNMVFTSPELGPTAELPPEAFTADPATGAITLLGNYTLKTDDQVFVTYTVDVDDAAFGIDSLANLVALGALSKIGAKFYGRANSLWQFITDMREDYTKKITDLRDGQWLPNEIRQMRFWQEVIPEADKKTSFQMGRLRRA